MKIGDKIMFFAIGLVVFSVVAVSTLSTIENSSNNRQVARERLHTAEEHLSCEISSKLAQAEQASIMLAQNERFLQALKTDDFSQMKNTLDELNSKLGCDLITITDGNGDVVIRQHEPSKFGDSALSQNSVRLALQGKSSFNLEPGTAVKLSCRAGAPIFDENKNVIGTVVTGYSFQKDQIYEELKGIHHTEFAVFFGTELVATTFSENGNVMQNLSVPADIAAKVLSGEEVFKVEKIGGHSYTNLYSPLKNQDKEIIGIALTGISRDFTIKATIDELIHIAIVSIIIIAISVFIVSRFVKNSIRKPMHQLATMANTLADCKLDVSVDEKLLQNGDEISELSIAMNKMATQLQSYIGDISKVLTAMADKDLTVQSGVTYIGDFVPVEEALQKILHSFNQTLLQIHRVAQNVNTSANQVSAGAQSLAQGATEQASSIEELSTTISEVSNQITQSAEFSQTANDLGRQTGQIVLDNRNEMKQMTASIKEIADASENIQKIVRVIEDIAFQTNILALNAAVEAARAGEAGKGFAVVADEVRNLAQKSSEAAKNTTVLIENTLQLVDKGEKIVTNTDNAFEKVVADIRNMLEMVEKFANTANEQANSVAQISVGVNQISSVVHLNTATSEESAAASEKLSRDADMLKSMITDFQIVHQ